MVQFEHTQSAYYRRAARRPERAQPAQPRLGRRRAARLASAPRRRRVAARAQPRGGPARRRAARAAARRPRALRLRGRTRPRSRPRAATRCWRPTASTTTFFDVPLGGAGERVAVLRPLRLRAEPARARALPRRGVARGAQRAAQPHAWPSRAAGWTRRCGSALERARGVEVLGLVADLPGALAAARAVIVPIWEGGGTRLKVLEALAAGAGGRRPRRSASPASASRPGGTGCSARPRDELARRCRAARAIPRAPPRWARAGARARRALPLAARRSPAPAIVRRVGLVTRGQLTRAWRLAADKT